LKRLDDTEKMKKRERLLRTVNETAGVLKKYPVAAKELHAIASRDGEDDRKDTQI
ncbi:MAG: hypothetical protein K0Q73_3774, partial [Paenibacillus sp.]|nr:hypothetical protein [Paenibacillus sp.]